MKYSKQDMAVVLLYYLGFSGIRNFILKQRRFALARFLVFHDVLFDEQNRLENNLRFLKYNTNVISLDDFFSGRMSVNKINIVITFDDGYKGWVSHALPVLKRLNLQATFFISSGFVSLQKHDELNYVRKNLFVKLPPRKITGGLTFTDVRTLVSEGFTIGGHTLNHCSLDSIKDISKLRSEITEDKYRLEKMTGVKIDYFSYPTGAYTNPQTNLVDELIASGYKGAVTVVPGFNSTITNPYLLHRDIVDSWMFLPIFKARVLGNADVVRTLKRWSGLTL